MMKYMAWIVMALLIQAILANPTPADPVRCTTDYTLSNSNGRCEKIVTITCEGGTLDLPESFRTDCEEGEEADEDPEYPDYSQSISAVRCTHGYTLSNNNGRCEKIVTITCEELDLRESVRNDCEEGEEADEDPEYPDYSQSISAVRCTHGYTLSNRGRCQKIVTTIVDQGPLDLCALFNFGC